MSWPCYGKRWAAAARAIAPGGLMFYIGEGRGGCCATDEFFRLLDREFNRTAGCSMPVWPGIHEHSVELYRKRLIHETR